MNTLSPPLVTEKQFHRCDLSTLDFVQWGDPVKKDENLAKFGPEILQWIATLKNCLANDEVRNNSERL